MKHRKDNNLQLLIYCNTNLKTIGYVDNYDKDRYLEKNGKHLYKWPSFRISRFCNCPYLYIMVILMFQYLNTFPMIFVGLKCEFSFNKCLRRFDL